MPLLERDPIVRTTSLPGDREARKQLGAWYTPPEITKLIARWAIRAPDARVLDPAVGDGDFLLQSAERLTALGQCAPSQLLFGVDVSPEAVATTDAALSGRFGDGSNLLVGDFFELDPPGATSGGLPPVHAVVGNPPYIRYQRFTGRTRSAASRRARDAGVDLSDLSSSWAAFVVHATSFLSHGGRLALVLPEELIHAKYARQVRAFLRRVFRTTSLIGFDGYLFPRAQERVVLLLADGKGLSPAGQLRLARAPHPGSIDDLDKILESGEVFTPSESPEKWHVGSADAATNIVDRLAAEQKLIPLHSIARTGIGYVSGANNYFVLKPSEVARLNIPADVLRPTVLAAKQLPGAQLTADDFASMLAKDERCLLWTGLGLDRDPVARYVAEGRKNGIAERYKCRMRDPWYVVPGVSVPQAFLTYMSHEIPRLVLNSASAACSNNFLAVHFKDTEPEQVFAIVASFYNSASMLSAERVGRRYGGGVLKLEPSEAGQVLIPNFPRLNVGSLALLFGEVDRLLRARKAAEALSLADRVILGDAIGLDSESIALIHDSWARRRFSRAGLRQRQSP